MVKSKKALALLHEMSSYLLSDEAINDGRSKPSAFVRTRKLPFTTITGMILNSLTKSLQIELEDFFEYVLDVDQQITKQAFSKARQNIRPKFFMKLAQMPVRAFYQDGNYKTYGGYRLLAIDGMTLDLPDFANLRERFGHVGNQEQTVQFLDALRVFHLLREQLHIFDADRRSLLNGIPLWEAKWLAPFFVVLRPPAGAFPA